MEQLGAGVKAINEPGPPDADKAHGLVGLGANPPPVTLTWKLDPAVPYPGGTSNSALLTNAIVRLDTLVNDGLALAPEFGAIVMV